MVRHHVWIAIEEPFSDSENINPGAENDDETDAEYDPQREHRLAVHMHHSQIPSRHNITSLLFHELFRRRRQHPLNSAQ